MVRSKKPGISRLYNCCDGWKVSAGLRRRYILATHLLLLLLSSDGGASKHFNRGSVLRAGSAAVGVGRHGRKGELGFMGKGVQFHASEEEKKYYQLLNIYLSTNTYKELFHIQMWPTNAYGNAET